MPKKRKEGTVNTTISVSWPDKNKMRRLAKLRKTTKNMKSRHMQAPERIFNVFPPTIFSPIRFWRSNKTMEF